MHFFLDKLNPKNGILASLWNIIILVKWALTIIILIFLREYPGIEVVLLLYIQIVYQALFVWAKPFEDKSSYILTLVNESMITFYLYATLSLTDFVTTDNVQVQLAIRLYSGWLLLAAILSTAGINLGHFSYQGAKMIKDKIKEKLLKKNKKYSISQDDGGLENQYSTQSIQERKGSFFQEEKKEPFNQCENGQESPQNTIENQQQHKRLIKKESTQTTTTEYKNDVEVQEINEQNSYSSALKNPLQKRVVMPRQLNNSIVDIQHGRFESRIFNIGSEEVDFYGVPQQKQYHRPESSILQEVMRRVNGKNIAEQSYQEPEKKPTPTDKVQNIEQRKHQFWEDDDTFVKSKPKKKFVQKIYNNKRQKQSIFKDEDQ